MTTTMPDTTTKGFPIHSEGTAPTASMPLLRTASAAYGAIPNLHGILAEAPAALEGYEALVRVFARSGFSPAEQQVVYLAANYENECRYCMAGHAAMARGAGLPSEAVRAIRAGRAISEDRLEALRAFTSAVVAQRGWVGEDAVRAFLEAGFTRANVLELLVGIAAKTISNYANHLADTPLDASMGATVWAPPRERNAARKFRAALRT